MPVAVLWSTGVDEPRTSGVRVEAARLAFRARVRRAIWGNVMAHAAGGEFNKM